MIQVKLGNETFTVSAINPRRSFPLQATIWPVVLEAAGLLARLSAVSESPGPKDADKPEPYSRIAELFKKDLEEVLPIVQGAFSSFDYDKLAFVQRELLSETLVNGMRLFAAKPGEIDQFDNTMKARTLDTWHLMWLAVKETYPDFLVRLRAIVAPRAAAENSAA